MGTGEDSKTAKPVKTAPSTQETTPVTPSYHDWSSSMQAYYGAGASPPPFFATATPHPYMWGGQHALIPQYGAPIPYPALYPPGAVYPHPSTAQVPFSQIPTTMGQINVEPESKVDDGKDRASVIKKAKGTSGAAPAVGSKGSTVEVVKAASGSGNDGATESAESGSEDSSDTNDDSNQDEYARNLNNKNKGSFHQMLAEGANAQSNNTSGPSLHGNSANNLNIGGMELWNAGAVKMRPNHHQPATAVTPGGMIAASGQWVQDDRELKRQKRKQSNRESARRSRLRKQAECEELQVRVESLTSENHTLRDELNRLSEECEKLTSENNSIKEELTALCGPDAISKKLESKKLESNGVTHSRSNSDEGNS